MVNEAVFLELFREGRRGRAMVSLEEMFQKIQKNSNLQNKNFDLEALEEMLFPSGMEGTFILTTRCFGEKKARKFISF